MIEISQLWKKPAVYLTAGFLANALLINVMGIVGGGLAFAVVSGDLSKIGTEIDTNTKGFSNGIATALYLMGFGAGGTGVWKIAQSKKQQGQGMGEGITYAVGGAILMSLPSLMSFLSDTTFGADATTQSLNRLNVE